LKFVEFEQSVTLRSFDREGLDGHWYKYSYFYYDGVSSSLILFGITPALIKLVINPPL
jgi:hypothetical protein